MTGAGIGRLSVAFCVAILAASSATPMPAAAAAAQIALPRLVGKPVRLDARTRQDVLQLVRRKFAKEHLFGLGEDQLRVDRLSAIRNNGVIITCGVAMLDDGGRPNPPRPFWIWTFYEGYRKGQSDVTVAQSFRPSREETSPRSADCGPRPHVRLR